MLKVSAIAISDKHIYAGTLCGNLLWWPLHQLKSELSKPINTDYEEFGVNTDLNGDVAMVDQVQTLKNEGSFNLNPSSVNQLALLNQNLLIGQKNAFTVFSTRN